jgi:predicted nucleic acid-binding protein
MSRIALDTNILAYMTGVIRVPEDAVKVERIRQLIEGLATSANLVAPVQALGELFIVLRRAGLSADEARSILLEFAEAFATSPSVLSTALAAADLSVDHQVQFWDALILSAACDAGCTMLLSEDMHHGFVTRGMTVLNPLTEPMDPKIATLLSG